MLNIPKWKIFLTLIVCLYGIFIVFNNIFTAKEEKNINLGLDLRGGAYLLLEIDQKAYFHEKIKILKEEIRNKLRSAQIGYSNLVIEAETIKFNLSNLQENLNLVFKDLAKNIKITQNGSEVSISFSQLFLTEQKNRLLQQSVEIIRKRVDETGTKEPLIQPQGLTRIILQVPGLEDPERLKKLLGKTAKMSFHLVHPEQAIVQDLFFLPKGYLILESAEQKDLFYLVNEKAEILGDQLNDAQVTIYQSIPQVNFKFDSEGTRKFGQITSNNIGKNLAIILDNKVISAPVIREAIIGGEGVISGNYTLETANDLALLLRAGSLPAPINIIEERTVGPTLGADSIDSGKKAVLTGFILVLLLMLILYKQYGLMAIIALIMNIIFIFALLSSFGATLTLPGIAGIVLTIGMSVDTNVLIFERIREESNTGKSIYAVIDQGFNQALKTILDSNITTLIAAFILFNFGTGPVKGFAITLTFGIISSMFSAIFLTRIFIYSWISFKKPKKIII
ncbi:MAG: protein translocase subunit SecD [Rickettsiales bacterium]